MVLICSNTMHEMADAVQEGIRIPLLHIGDAAARAVKKEGLKKVGLLGTRFTMEKDFYRGRLADRYGLQVLIPEEVDREIIHRAIYDELCLGKLIDSSRQKFLDIIAQLVEQGARGIILGCTEIPLLVKPEDVSVPVFNTAAIHAETAVAEALRN